MKRVVLIVGILGVVAIAGVPLARYIKRANNPLEVGQCTWYCVERAHEEGWEVKFDQPYGRHAKFWPDRVANSKLVSTPSAGSIMVLGGWSSNPYGHVAYVESVEDPDHWTITHANMGLGRRTGRSTALPFGRRRSCGTGARFRLRGGKGGSP